MKQLSVLIKPASSLCNLRCKYCFYADVSSSREVRSYGVMSRETSERIIDQLFLDLESGDALTIAFQGGEPTLAGLPFFEHFVAYTAEKSSDVTVSYALQTNGILLDDSWCAFLKKHNFLVGLSWDGPPALHNKNRMDEKGQGTYSSILEARRKLQRHGIEHNILCVLTNETARHPQQIWSFIEAQKIDYIQFIPCLDELDGSGQSWALTPKRFCSFYTALFELWHKRLLSGRYVSVKLFDDIANLFVFGRATACGITGRCGMQYVIESDGSVYPCDFYVLDDYRLGNAARQSPEQLMSEYHRRGMGGCRAPLPAPCGACPYLDACQGGCRRMETAMYIDGDTCGYRELLDRILIPLCRDARMLASQPT